MLSGANACAYAITCIQERAHEIIERGTLVISAQRNSHSLDWYVYRVVDWVSQETELRLLWMRIEDDVWAYQDGNGTSVAFDTVIYLRASTWPSCNTSRA
jgi:hypothetical protein